MRFTWTQATQFWTLRNNEDLLGQIVLKDGKYEVWDFRKGKVKVAEIKETGNPELDLKQAQVAIESRIIAEVMMEQAKTQAVNFAEFLKLVEQERVEE